MTDDADDAPPEASSNAPTDAAGDGTDEDAADTFGVAIHVTEEELRFVVHVPSQIDSGWTDPEEFQELVQRVVWDELDQEATLRAIATDAETGDTVTLGTVTLQPDGTVVSHTLESPAETA